MKSQECFKYNSSFVVTIGPVLPKKTPLLKSKIDTNIMQTPPKNYSLFGFSAAKEKKNHTHTQSCVHIRVQVVEVGFVGIKAIQWLLP